MNAFDWHQDGRDPLDGQDSEANRFWDELEADVERDLAMDKADVIPFPRERREHRHGWIVRQQRAALRRVAERELEELYPSPPDYPEDAA